MLTQEIVKPPRPQPVAQPTVTPARVWPHTLLPTLATGGLLWLSYFPVDWGWLGWVALVPLLTLVKSEARPRTIYLSAWAGGLLFFWPALQWMRVADYRMYFTWTGLATYCSLYFPAGLYLIRLLDRRTRLPFVVTVPVVWVALEFFRSFFGTGFPWYLLAHTQHDYLRAIQIADVTGAWGVSFLIAAVNALLCMVWLTVRGRPVASGRRLVFAGAVLACALAGTLGYGVWRTGQTAFERGPTVAIVQGNLPQYLRNNPTTAESIAAHYVALCEVAAKSKPALIVTPETSMPFHWEEAWPGGLKSETHELCTGVSRRFRAPILLGLNSEVQGADRVNRRYNSAALVDERGHAVARYDKIHRVPFGEYVPLRDWLPFMNWFAPYDFDYSVMPGSGATRFPLAPGDAERDSLTFGVVICYEDTDPDVTRQAAGADGQRPADLLLNISNDGWFEGTSEHEQHLAVCRFRAIECRRPVARSVNMGISALMDGNGRVLAPTTTGTVNVPSGLEAAADLPDKRVHPPHKAASAAPAVGAELAVASRWEVGPDADSLPPARWGEFKKVCGVLLATVPLDTRHSVYAQCGDWLPWSCWGLLGICGITIARRKGP
jgi:apolipoprotein N-acyltransferase